MSRTSSLSRVPIELNLNEGSNASSTRATANSAESDSLDLIPTSESCLNKFKFQYNIKLVDSGSAAIKIEKIFNNTRKIAKI